MDSGNGLRNLSPNTSPGLGCLVWLALGGVYVAALVWWWA